MHLNLRYELAGKCSQLPRMNVCSRAARQQEYKRPNLFQLYKQLRVIFVLLSTVEGKILVIKYSLQAACVQSYTDCLGKIRTSSAGKCNLFCDKKYFSYALTWDNFNYFTFQQMSPSSSRNIEPFITNLGSTQAAAEIPLFSGERKKE